MERNVTEEWKKSSSWKVQRNATMKKSHILILLVLVGESARMELISTVILSARKQLVLETEIAL